MTNYREVLRLESLGINNTQIALSVGCTRQTVISVLKKAKQKNVSYRMAQELSDRELMEAIQDGALNRKPYRMPDYEKVHKELMKSGVTLNLLWVEYCEECRKAGELPYQSTQFNKHYAEYARKRKPLCVLSANLLSPWKSTGAGPQCPSSTMRRAKYKTRMFLSAPYPTAGIRMWKHFGQWLRKIGSKPI